MARQVYRFAFKEDGDEVDTVLYADSYQALRDQLLYGRPDVIIKLGENRLSQQAWDYVVPPAAQAAMAAGVAAAGAALPAPPALPLKLVVKYPVAGVQASTSVAGTSEEIAQLRAAVGRLEASQHLSTQLLNDAWKQTFTFKAPSASVSTASYVSVDTDGLKADAIDHYGGVRQIVRDNQTVKERRCMVTGLWFPSPHVAMSHIIPSRWWGLTLQKMTLWDSPDRWENIIFMHKSFEVAYDQGRCTLFNIGNGRVQVKILDGTLSKVGVYDFLRTGAGKNKSPLIDRKLLNLPQPAGFKLKTFGDYDNAELVFEIGKPDRPGRRAINVVAARALLEARTQKYNPGQGMEMPPASWSSGMTDLQERILAWLHTPAPAAHHRIEEEN